MTTVGTQGAKIAKKIRAKFSQGKIEPLEELDLEEGEEVK